MIAALTALGIVVSEVEVMFPTVTTDGREVPARVRSGGIMLVIRCPFATPVDPAVWPAGAVWAPATESLTQAGSLKINDRVLTL
jgi:hypothetical protein